jgi:hypothetical protein
MKKHLGLFLPILGAFVFLVLGIERAFEWRKVGEQARRNESLRQAIEEADAMEETRASLQAYQAIAPPLPDVQLRILQKQWVEAIELLHQIQRAKFNRLLEGEVPRRYAELTEHLDSMKERCAVLLTEDVPLRNEIAWRVYNIEGAARLLAAFTVLETERNWKKVLSAMEAAISAFKAAIETVDATASGRSLERSVPRWNLELLHADIYVKQRMRVQPDEERLGLRDNLEAVIPEKGGYAPGEPLERRIRK